MCADAFDMGLYCEGGRKQVYRKSQVMLNVMQTHCFYLLNRTIMSSGNNSACVEGQCSYVNVTLCRKISWRKKYKSCS